MHYEVERLLNVAHLQHLTITNLVHFSEGTKKVLTLHNDHEHQKDSILKEGSDVWVSAA
jgi:hypothetical protein